MVSRYRPWLLTVNNLKMNANEGSLNSIVELPSLHLNHQVHNRCEEIVHDPIRQLDEGLEAETPTPAKPPVETGQAEPAVGNPEPGADCNDAKELKGLSFSKKMALILGVIVLIAVAGTITAVVKFLNRRRLEVVTENYLVTNKLVGSDADLQTQRIRVTDPETFNSDKPLPVYATKVLQKRFGGHFSSGIDIRWLQEEQPYATFSFRDEATDTTISVSSRDLQLRASINLNSVLEYVLNNQPLPEYIEDTPRNLQDADPSAPAAEPAPYREFTFYNVNEEISSTVKSVLVTLDQNVKISQEVTHFIQFNKEENAYEFTNGKLATPAESVAFHDPATTPVISNTNNETEVAGAVTQVVTGILLKAKQFLSERVDELEAAAKVQLRQTDRSNGATSIYVDQPQDIAKLCANVNDATLTCDSRALSSDAINLSAPKPGDNVDPSATLVVLIDV